MTMTATNKAKILIVEDDPDIREVLEYNLRREGYRIHSCGDGAEGLELARQVAPDLVLLDLMLPGVDGIELCRMIKQDAITRSAAVIMVTAKGEESDVVLGLGVGADDYVSKPFSPREVLARIEAVLRRGALRTEAPVGERVVCGPVVIDVSRHEVLSDGQAVDLTATEMRLLHFLASHPGRVFSRAQLLSRVIGENAIVIERNIDVHVRSIRKKLGEHRDLIQTVRGVGYRFRSDRD